MPSSPIDGPTSGDLYVRALQWGGWKWTDGAPAGTNITYFFQGAGADVSELAEAPAGTLFSTEWQSFEKQAYRAALQKWADVANISFTEVGTYAAANLVEHRYNDTYDPNTLGVHAVPEDAALTDGTAWGAYNYRGDGWTTAGLKEGGYGFITLVHELGHALGLAHPFDDGGGSPIFPGSGDGGYGKHDLNQGIFTVMSYNDGWETGIGLSPSNNYGWQSGPMAFDIAAIQYLYGPNTDYHKGNNTYILRHVDGQPDDLSCIWDAGGTDAIVYGGRFDCVIDLRAATLRGEAGGGGFVSYAQGAPDSHKDHWNAFTIANGVVIENVKGGRGDDWIGGNGADNTLNGAGGNDKLTGRGGDDVLIGGSGEDKLSGGPGEDVFVFGSTSHSRSGKHDHLVNFRRGTDEIDLEAIDAKTGASGNQTFNWIGKQGFHDKKGELHYKDLGSKVLVEADVNGDGKPDFAILVNVGKIGGGDFIL